jgi:hypothetical protein
MPDYQNSQKLTVAKSFRRLGSGSVCRFCTGGERRNPQMCQLGAKADASDDDAMKALQQGFA